MAKAAEPTLELAQFQLKWNLNGKFQGPISIVKEIFPGCFFWLRIYKAVAFKDTVKERERERERGGRGREEKGEERREGRREGKKGGRERRKAGGIFDIDNLKNVRNLQKT